MNPGMKRKKSPCLKHLENPPNSLKNIGDRRCMMEEV
jgi:hypothetical protein